ncbi:MAG: hypothetical protein EA425_13780 [Puniceicoccaceae bacterium]|nr:MAG: hypothetical protein EA425_13780 [Puniceicoccaceae bacterium]
MAGASGTQTSTGRRKLFWFGATVAAFRTLRTLFWSWQITVITALVILYHALGHVAGMKLVGYRRLRILFLPLAGPPRGQNFLVAAAPWSPPSHAYGMAARVGRPQ